MKLSNVPFTATALLAIFSLPCFAQPNTNPKILPWGEPNQWLRMSLSIHNPDSAVPEVYIAFENVGDSNRVLLLSEWAGMKPDAVRLVITDQKNNSMEFYFSDEGIKVGRQKFHYFVPLRVGSAYILKLYLGDFLMSQTFKRPSDLDPGRYRISARFEGRGSGEEPIASYSWMGMVKFWTGQLRSNEVEFVKK